MTFKEIGLDERLLEAISYMGFDNATAIQEQAIPQILKGRDLIACAQTGTGKTAAFMLPLLHQMAVQPHNGTSTLVIVPTRELAVQIDQQIQGFAYFVRYSVISAGFWRFFRRFWGRLSEFAKSFGTKSGCGCRRRAGAGCGSPYRHRPVF